MPENYNLIDNNGVKLYIRHIPSAKPSKKAIILMNSRSLCVESSMGIPMGSRSFGEYMADSGIHAFLLDMRGYGLSDPVEEQLVESTADLTKPLSINDYYSDVIAARNYIVDTLGPDTEVSILGFSFLGTLVITCAHLYPDAFKNVISLNPNWINLPVDPPRGVKFWQDNPDVPYNETSIEKINNRLHSSQPTGKDFTETTWAEEAAAKLSACHRTFNHETGTWRYPKDLEWNNHLANVGTMKNVKANLLFITAQYDTENPYFIVKRLFDTVGVRNKYLKVLPNSTHLCIWEKSRQTLYKWTAEFIL